MEVPHCAFMMITEQTDSQMQSHHDKTVLLGWPRCHDWQDFAIIGRILGRGIVLIQTSNSWMDRYLFNAIRLYSVHTDHTVINTDQRCPILTNTHEYLLI